MKINTRLHCKDEEIKVKSCVAEKIIELSDEEYESLCEDLMLNRDYITENNNLMYEDKNGVTHCLLVLGEGYDDGILINSEGYDYARYYSVIPNARQLVILDKYPVLNNYIERMSEVADDVLRKAIAQSTKEKRSYEINVEEYNNPGEPIINAAMLDDMLTDSGMIEDSRLHEDYIELMLTEQAVNTQYRESYDVNSSSELEIICARHALWIYGENGGEQADFSNCRLNNIDFSDRNLCSANFNGAEFINCKFNDASMCFCDFQNAKFKNCSLENLAAEEADFKGSYFDNCDLKSAYFTHSNFTNSKMLDCITQGTSLKNCCIESLNFVNCNIKTVDLSNVSYFESYWLSEQSQDESPVQSM